VGKSNTCNRSKRKGMAEILRGLAVNGKLIAVGASNEPIQMPTFLMILGRRSMVGSLSVLSSVSVGL